MVDTDGGFCCLYVNCRSLDKDEQPSLFIEFFDQIYNGGSVFTIDVGFREPTTDEDQARWGGFLSRLRKPTRKKKLVVAARRINR